MTAATRHDLLRLLGAHVGAETGITAEALAEALGVNKREVRHLVTQLREQGIAVCGHPRTGYFIAANAEELQATCAFLRSRAMCSLALEAKLRNVPLADLLGQLRLPT